MAASKTNHGLAFIMVTVLIDSIGFGIVIPVLPGLIVELSGRSIAGAAQISGWLMFGYAIMQFVFGPVMGALSGNHAGFHHASGAGYALLADWLIRLDPVNPQTAARMSTAFESWPRYDADRQAMMRGALQRIIATPGLSRDLSEMAGRMLAG